MKPYLTLSAVLLCFGWSGACFAQSQPQSLAEMVKHSKTGKKKEVLKLTDDNLPFARSQETEDSEPAPQHSASAASTPAASPAPATSTPGKQDAAKPAASAAKAPQDRVKQLEGELASYKQQEQTWSNSASDYEQKLAKESNEFRRNTYREALDNDRGNVSYFRQKVADTETQLQQARESAKKTGN